MLAAFAEELQEMVEVDAKNRECRYVEILCEVLYLSCRQWSSTSCTS